MSLLRKLTRSTPRKPHKSRAPFRPALEGLEDRTVPTVTFHGGAVLPHVKIQALFVGSRWASDPTLFQQAQYLSGFVRNLVTSTYMDALSNAGYGVGRGSAAGAKIDTTVPTNKNSIDKIVTADIASRALQFPDANTLYVVFVQPDITMSWPDGTTSATVAGAHSAFALHISGVATPSRTVRYVTIAYPGGTVGNAGVPFLSTLDSLTVAASREIADAVTDADLGFYDSAHPTATRPRGWYDGARNAEVGDVVTNRVVYVNGYAVQRVVNKNDFLMTPAQAAPNRVINFVLQPDGTLLKVTGAATTTLLTGVAAVSDQGIDNQGRAMVDVVDKVGNAWEFHDDGGAGTWTYLGSGVKSAKAGQGVSYLLFNTGAIFEFDDASGASRYVYGPIAGLGFTSVMVATQIDAGTDAQGVNAVDAIVPGLTVVTVGGPVFGAVATGAVGGTGAAYEYSDDSGAHLIASGVTSVSAGRQGNSVYITTAGTAHWHAQAGGDVVVGWNVAQATAGTDPNGAAMVDVLLNNGTLSEFRSVIGWYTVATDVKAVSKGRLGAVDMVRKTSPIILKTVALTAAGTVGTGVNVPGAFEHTLSGWRFLGSPATAAV